MTPALSFGRILLASIFLISGARKAFAFAPTAEFMRAHGLPAAEILLVAAIALELAGGAMLVLDVLVAPAAFVLAAFCIVSGLIFHNPWTSDAAQYMNQFNHFLKNVALAGGLVIAGATAKRT